MEDGKFNFESGNKTEFEGNKTLTQITKYWKRFTELDRETQDKFVTDILTIVKRLSKKYCPSCKKLARMTER